MRIIHFIMILLLYGMVLRSAGQEHFHVDRTGKPIQADGFLIEWNSENADTVSGVVSVVVDAVNTSLGLAGYVRFTGEDSCMAKAVKVYPNMHKMHRLMTMVFDTTAVASGFYGFEKSHEGDATSITAEWSIPWDSISLDSSGQYEVGLLLSDDCGNSPEPVILSGKRTEEAKERIFTRKVNIQIITIVILLLLFIRLRARAKKLKARKG